MKNLNVSCIKSDLEVSYFENIDKHLNHLNDKIQSKLGEYASVTCNSVADEDGGKLKLSLGVYDVRDELLNFRDDVVLSTKMNKSVIDSTIKYLIENYDLNIDIDWEESEKETSIILYIDGEDYSKSDGEWKSEDVVKILSSLHESVSSFINFEMNESIKQFNYHWVMEYSQYED